MKKSILLCIIDCLRFDRVCKEKMPFLTGFAKRNTFFTNYWSSSHCTDPSITHMLTGKHPDELRLYSMMYGSKWDLPKDVEMISQTALRSGYHTGFITNLGRWYRRGVESFVDCRGWPGKRIFQCAKEQVVATKKPWLLIVHTDDMHTRYTGGSYDAAARAVDNYLRDLFTVVDMENTVVIVTSDHGEGLGQAGPDGKAIDQHGYGLWDFLTHVPLITNFGEGTQFLVDNQSIYDALYQVVQGGSENLYIVHRDYVFQAGATPKVFHRGVVMVDQTQFIRETMQNKFRYYCVGKLTDSDKRHMEKALQRHCKSHDIKYRMVTDEEFSVFKRLKGLGYWE